MSTLGAENLYSFPKKPFSNEIWRRAATDAPCQSEPGIQIKAALVAGLTAGRAPTSNPPRTDPKTRPKTLKSIRPIKTWRRNTCDANSFARELGAYHPDPIVGPMAPTTLLIVSLPPLEVVTDDAVVVERIF